MEAERSVIINVILLQQQNEIKRKCYYTIFNIKRKKKKVTRLSRNRENRFIHRLNNTTKKIKINLKNKI